MISVNIVTWNNENDISICLKSLIENSRSNVFVSVIDNASSDNTVINVKKFFGVRLIQNSINTGFAGAHNQGIRMTETPYVLILNPDTKITTNFIEELLRAIESDPKIGMVCGKLIQGNDDVENGVIDSTGLVMSRNRRVFDRGQGELDIGQYDAGEFVFGCSGAAVLYRREMLEDIRICDDYFDESFFAYKEDIDLVWRAQLKGWKAYYTPKAVAYHERGWQSGKRQRIPKFVQIHSFKNRYLMVLKNEEWQNLLLDLPFFLFYEIGVLVYILFRAPYLLKGWMQVISLLQQTLIKRARIQKDKSISYSEMRKWFA